MQCNYKKKDKQICKASAMHGDSKCYMHSKKIPEEDKKDARQKGGANKSLKVNKGFQQYALETIQDVIKLNTDLVNAVLQNEIDLRISTGLGYNLQLQMKLLELRIEELKTELPERIHIILPPEMMKGSL